jgi:hypothetical protein
MRAPKKRDGGHSGSSNSVLELSRKLLARVSVPILVNAELADTCGAPQNKRLVYSLAVRFTSRRIEQESKITMSFLAWIILGLIAGFVGSKIVN